MGYVKPSWGLSNLPPYINPTKNSSYSWAWKFGPDPAHLQSVTHLIVLNMLKSGQQKTPGS